VVETKPNNEAAELSVVVLKTFPDKARPADELEELKQLYKPGEKVSFIMPSF
jgi:hypothetical protein